MGSLSGELRGTRTSFEVEMLTTEGIALRTAPKYESARDTGGAAAAGTSCCMTICGGGRVGSHSGLSVETTNSTARQIVAVCEKMIQRRRMGFSNLSCFAFCFNNLDALA